MKLQSSFALCVCWVNVTAWWKSQNGIAKPMFHITFSASDRFSSNRLADWMEIAWLMLRRCCFGEGKSYWFSNSAEHEVKKKTTSSSWNHVCRNFFFSFLRQWKLYDILFCLCFHIPEIVLIKKLFIHESNEEEDEKRLFSQWKWTENVQKRGLIRCNKSSRFKRNPSRHLDRKKLNNLVFSPDLIYAPS